MTDANQTAQLWTEVVGLRIMGRAEGRLDLGLDGSTLVSLHNDASEPAQARATGLFHLALELPTRLDLARAAQRLLDVGHSCTGQDHLVNESVYFADRDGITIELTVSTPERGSIEIRDGHPYFQILNGAPHSGVAPLDMRRLRNEVIEHGPGPRTVPTGTIVSHVHLRSNTPAATMRFYTQCLGFKPHVASNAFGMFDCGTRTRPHLVALNNWYGTHLPRPSNTSSGLRSFTIELPAAKLDALIPELAATTTWDGSEWALTDPEGNHLSLRPM